MTLMDLRAVTDSTVAASIWIVLRELALANAVVITIYEVNVSLSQICFLWYPCICRTFFCSLYGQF